MLYASAINAKTTGISAEFQAESAGLSVCKDWDTNRGRRIIRGLAAYISLH